MNLAALESVDYVIIDDNATPLENLKFIQPDFFAKGYEYSAEGIHPKTREEMDAGILRGPDSFHARRPRLSSSAIIETMPPNLATEKLLALLHSEGLDFDDLQAALRTEGREGACRGRYHRRFVTRIARSSAAPARRRLQREV